LIARTARCIDSLATAPSTGVADRVIDRLRSDA
jgi:hypothetical protein